MAKEIKKIAFVLSTNGLENDDRVRKEVISIQKNGGYEITIFAKVTENKYKEGVTSYGTPYKLIYLKTRDIFSSSRFLIFKIMEMYFRLRRELKQYDLIWCADDGMFIFPLLIRKIRIIWDLHEIPILFLKNSITRQLFHFIERQCDLIIHANQFRLKYLLEEKIVSQPRKHIIIRNFPDREFINSTLLPNSYYIIKKWLKGTKYVYLQGISADSRYPYNSVASILSTTDYKIIITADKVDEDVNKKLQVEFAEAYFNRVYFTGMLDQLYTPSVIKEAVFSMVFYNINTPNNRYCEANRFYQSLVFGVPVICGCNEPMKEMIDNYHCGIALESDGSNVYKIKAAIKKILDNYSYYKNNAAIIKDVLIWDDKYISDVIQKLECGPNRK